MLSEIISFTRGFDGRFSKAYVLSKGKKANSKMNSDAKGKVGKAAGKFVDKFLESLS